jgi:nucleotide-binding universal stress UspA family protein
MFGLAKILLPVDFSKRSEQAAYYAGMLACRFHSEITVLHAVPAAEYPIAGMDPGAVFAAPTPFYMDELRAKLNAFMADEFRGMRVNRLLLEGDPAARIVETAAAENSDLIVMPTHGYGRFRRFVLGSVTAKVLHDADCPVFTGAHLDQEPHVREGLFQNVLCAIDLGPQSKKVIEWGAGIAHSLNARLHVVHALPELDAGQARYFDQDWRIAIERSARERIESTLAETDARANVVLDDGDVHRVVRNAAQSVGADLVVIGRHASAGILGRLREHTYAIVRESPCPVVSV